MSDEIVEQTSRVGLDTREATRSIKSSNSIWRDRRNGSVKVERCIGLKISRLGGRIYADIVG